MAKRTLEDVVRYVENQCKDGCKVLSAKPEQHFNDMDEEVRVWNVKTNLE